MQGTVHATNGGVNSLVKLKTFYFVILPHEVNGNTFLNSLEIKVSDNCNQVFVQILDFYNNASKLQIPMDGFGTIH